MTLARIEAFDAFFMNFVRAPIVCMANAVPGSRSEWMPRIGPFVAREGQRRGRSQVDSTIGYDLFAYPGDVIAARRDGRLFRPGAGAVYA